MEATIARYTHVWITFPDGCEFRMEAKQGPDAEKYKLNIQGTTQITCPHGLVEGFNRVDLK